MKAIFFGNKSKYPELVSLLQSKNYTVCERSEVFFKSEPKGELELDAVLVITDNPNIQDTYRSYDIEVQSLTQSPSTTEEDPVVIKPKRGGKRGSDN